MLRTLESTVEILAEIPEELHLATRAILDKTKLDWDEAIALALTLLIQSQGGFIHDHN